MMITFTLGFGYINGWFNDSGYNTVRVSSEDMSAVEFGSFINRKWGFIDQSGNEVIPCIYFSVMDFSEDLAAANNGKWGFIDKNGNEVVPFVYDAVLSFSEGLAAVRVGNSLSGRWGFIDKNGNVVIPFDFDFAGSFSEGLASVRIESKYGYIDPSGNTVIPFVYDSAGSFSNGYASVGERRSEHIGTWRLNWGLIDKNGNLVVPMAYATVRELDDNLLRVTVREYASNRTNATNELLGVFDRTSGVEIIPCRYRRITIEGNLIEAQLRSGEEHIYDRQGNRVN